MGARGRLLQHVRGRDLLTYTELPGRRDFARHVDIETGYAADETEPLIAVVRDWDKLLTGSTVRFTGGDLRSPRATRPGPSTSASTAADSAPPTPGA